MHLRFKTAATAVIVSLLAAAAGIVGFAGPAQAATNYWYGTARQNFTGTATTGVAASLAMANPYVDTANDVHSLAEIAATNAASTNGVEAGWRKTTGSVPDLFVFPDIAGVSTAGCYNACGWVDYASNPLNAGSPVPSGDLGVGKIFTIQHTGGAWWVGYAGGWLGYYPDSVWTAYGQTFTSLQVGRAYGEVATLKTAPCTDMGDGLLPSPGPAAYVSSWQKYDTAWSAGDFTTTVQVLPAGTSTSAYAVSKVSATKFLYGGPGFC